MAQDHSNPKGPIPSKTKTIRIPEPLLTRAEEYLASLREEGLPYRLTDLIIVGLDKAIKERVFGSREWNGKERRDGEAD